MFMTESQSTWLEKQCWAKSGARKTQTLEGHIVASDSVCSLLPEGLVLRQLLSSSGLTSGLRNNKTPSKSFFPTTDFRPFQFFSLKLGTFPFIFPSSDGISGPHFPVQVLPGPLLCFNVPFASFCKVLSQIRSINTLWSLNLPTCQTLY